MSTESGKAHADVNAWFLSLPEGQQAVLREDKWMLASAAFDAGKSDPVRAALVEALKAMLVGTTEDCGKIRHPSEQAVIASFAALRAAGVVLP